MANMVKRNQISDFVVVIKARRNKVAAASWDTSTENGKSYRVKEMTDSSAATPSAPYIAGLHIRNKIESGFKGQIGLVIADDAALKAFALQKIINKGTLAMAEKYIDTNQGFSWMSEDWRDALKDFAEVLYEAKQNGNVIAITKESNLYSWELRGETETLKDGEEIKLIAKKDSDSGYWTSTNEEGTIACENQFVNGTFKVHEFVIHNNNAGTQRSIWRIDRVLAEEDAGNEYDNHIRNIRSIHKLITQQLPSIKVVKDIKLQFTEEVA